MRVNPRDCLSAIDVVQQAGIAVQGMSFAQICALAFSSLLEACRARGVIPTRDGFEFDEMMTGFPADTGHARKMAISKAVESVGSELRVPPPQPVKAWNPEVARAERRYKELAARKEFDPLNWTPQDQEEMDGLFKELFPGE